MNCRTVQLGDVASFIHGITFKPTDIVMTGTPGSIICMRTKGVQYELDEPAGAARKVRQKPCLDTPDR